VIVLLLGIKMNPPAFDSIVISVELPRDDICIERLNNYFVKALTAENSKKIDEASDIYRLKEEEYLSLNICHLALHALIDFKEMLNERGCGDIL